MDGVPIKHHFIPVFYLRNWATASDGKLCEFSKPYKEIVKAKRVFPTATGYEENLYTVPGLAGPHAQQIENGFMKYVDDTAALILAEIVNDKLYELDDKRKSDWTRFMLSLLLRNPEEVTLLKKQYVEDWYKWTPEREKGYQKRRKKGHPKTFRDFLALTKEADVIRYALQTFLHLMDNKAVGDRVVQMKWGQFRIPFGTGTLLTSDRPLIMSDGLRYEHGHIVLPISPNRFFYAVTSDKLENFMRYIGRSEIVGLINRAVVAQASNYVYGQYDVHKPFVYEHMGKGKLEPFMLRMRQS